MDARGMVPSDGTLITFALILLVLGAGLGLGAYFLLRWLL